MISNKYSALQLVFRRLHTTVDNACMQVLCALLDLFEIQAFDALVVTLHIAAMYVEVVAWHLHLRGEILI